MGIGEKALRICWCEIAGSGFQPKVSVENNKRSSCLFIVAAYNYSNEIANHSYQLQSSAYNFAFFYDFDTIFMTQ